MTKTGDRSVLLDLGNKVRSIKNYNTGSVETSPLPTETITATEPLIAGFIGLVPFADVSAIPDDAEWNRVGNDDLDIATKATEIYELAWLSRAYDGSTVFNKWLFSVDSKSNLPQRIEIYRKTTGDIEYILSSTMEIKYLSDGKMKAIINDVSF